MAGCIINQVAPSEEPPDMNSCLSCVSPRLPGQIVGQWLLNF